MSVLTANNAANKGTDGIKSITEVIQRHEVHVGSRLIASVSLIRVPNGSAGLVRSASGDNVVTLAQGGLAALGTFSNWYQGFNGLKQDYMQIDVADYNGQKVFQIMEQRYSLPMNRFVTVPLYTNSIDFQNVVTGVNWHD